MRATASAECEHSGVQNNLLTICGLSTVRALAAAAPERIERLFFDETNAPRFAEVCRYLSQKRKIYRLVTPAELKKITDTSHHQGVAAVIHAPEPLRLEGLELSHSTLCLHDVKNPHNVGAILRTTAFFGVRDVIFSRKSYDAAMTASAWRVAEGGVSLTHCYVYEDAHDLFSRAKMLGWWCAAAVRPEKGRLPSLESICVRAGRAHVVACLGNEEEGLPGAFVAGCGYKFTILGSGSVESLNVSVTAALCLEKMSRNYSGLRPE
ncbi:TrmH family RNA methyltransferase [Turneriella parva]|uniref:TrmH family RNA methyltransferase n=1 Tax=Turneriella parva TaxID=29510 RepID=UPI00145E52AD|nr:RNA methyltransferase [Turneriella parva]